ncbi:MAG: YicC family protein [Candidatus Omnitrophica bacterium]|nr:YicC family protein [Candidatus Omnitrophota bacterium]
MIRSMTGYGDARSGRRAGTYSVEIRSVNQRFFDLQVRLPSELACLESEVKKLLQTEIVRGKVTAFIGIEGMADSAEELSLDFERARFYISLLKQVEQKLKIKNDISAREILSFSNVLKIKEKTADTRKIWTAMKPVLEQALRAFVHSREKEGKIILDDLEGRLKTIVKRVREIEAVAKNLPALYKQKLDRRIKELTHGLMLDEEKLLKETALVAERSDMTEEIVRLLGHIELFGKILKEKGDVGKRLDFVVQEMNRETNTIGSKCSDFSIAGAVVEIKSELEKIREQIQNVE